MAALLEMVRLFSRLASQPGQNGLSRFNLVFVLTGGGKLNYLGSKKLLEDQLDSVDGGLFQVSFRMPKTYFIRIFRELDSKKKSLHRTNMNRI